MFTRTIVAAIPDTRNIEWSPRKSFGSYRQQSGQLLYFLSGFLTLQLEIQTFLASTGLGGPVIPTQALDGHRRPFDSLILGPSAVTRSIAEALMDAISPHDVFTTVVNSTSSQRQGRPTFSTPLYHRAFPTHRYEQSTFWHVYGSMIATALIIYFSLPAAVTAGAFRREVGGGQLDSLSTLPGTASLHHPTMTLQYTMEF